MAQIINDPGRSGMFGQAAAGGLANLLQGLATRQGQVNQMNQQRALFNRLYPDNPGFADLLSMFGNQPKIQQSLMENLAKQQETMRGKEQLANYFESIGLARNLVDQPQWVQKKAVDEVLSGAKGGAFNAALSYARGEPATRQPGQVTQAPQGQQPKVGQVTPEQAEQLRQQGYDVPLANEDTSFLQRLGSFGVGFGTGTLGRWGDTIQGLRSLLEPSKESQAATQQELADLGPVPKFLSEIPYLQQQRTFPELPIPTSKGLQKGLQAVTKGTSAEKYTKPQTSTQEWYQDMGRVVSWLTNPVQALKKGAMATIKNLAGGLGAGLVGDTAGWMAENVTGSKAVGEGLKNGIWLAYNLFPGSLGQVARKEYQNFTDKVIKPAEAQGKVIDLTKYKTQFDALKKELNKLVPESDAYKYVANEMKPLENVIKSKYRSPEGWWTYVDEIKKSARNIPENASQARPYVQKIANFAEDVLHDFSKKINPIGAQSLKDANRLYAQSVQAANTFKETKKAITDNVGVGVFLMLGGGIRKLLAAGASVATGNYIRKMIADPTMRKYMSEVASASMRKNTAQVSNLLKKINKRAEKIDPYQARLILQQAQGQSSEGQK